MQSPYSKTFLMRNKLLRKTEWPCQLRAENDLKKGFLTCGLPRAAVVSESVASALRGHCTVTLPFRLSFRAPCSPLFTCVETNSDVFSTMMSLQASHQHRTFTSGADGCPLAPGLLSWRKLPGLLVRQLCGHEGPIFRWRWLHCHRAAGIPHRIPSVKVAS